MAAMTAAWGMGMKLHIENIRQEINRICECVGNFFVDVFHYAALFAIGSTTVWAALQAFIVMGRQGQVSIEDILLLFIYLELGAMVGIYFKTSHMPVRFLIYVAITALTRMLIVDIQLNHRPDEGILLISGAILILALSTLIIRYASARFPSPSGREPH